MDILKTLLICGIIMVLTATTTWLAKDLIDPCPAVSCEPVIKVRAEVNDKIVDVILEDCTARVYPEAVAPGGE